MTQLRRRSASESVSAYMLTNFRHMFAFEDWWRASKYRFEWKPIGAVQRDQSSIDASAAGVFLRDGDIWMLGCWVSGGWARLTADAFCRIGIWHPTQWAAPDAATLMMLMAE